MIRHARQPGYEAVMTIGAVRRRFLVLATAIAVAVGPSTVAGASDMQLSRGGDVVTVSMVALETQKPGYDVLVPNFERVYPNIKIDVTYGGGLGGVSQLELTELGAGSAPDLLTTFPGCGTTISVCALAKAGDLAPMVDKPWATRSLPVVTSLSKFAQGLYAFEAIVAPVGVFTNDALFRKLGLKFPQTFSQFLALCEKAKADGTVAFLDGNSGGVQAWELLSLLAPLYVKDPHFTAEQRAGTMSFAGSPGWHQALQEYVDMNNSGCFEPGVTGTSITVARAQFALGQGLMAPGISSMKGAIDLASPKFSYSFRPFPNVSGSNKPTTILNLSPSLSVNAHSSAQEQAAAQTFIDFLARPKQNALYAQTVGGLSQYEFLKEQIPSFMSDFGTVFEEHEYALNPTQNWWNANVASAFAPIGLLTGQVSVDGLLNAMDAAWKQGPA
jgi:raffinose/stachyose/melibiose transport system substrate-binding protein